MSTLRNKNLVKSMQQREQAQRNQTIHIEDLRKISQAFVILKESNLKLNRMLKTLSAQYDDKYKIKIQRLRAIIAKKNRKIRSLRNECFLQNTTDNKRHILIGRQNSNIIFCTNVSVIDKNKDLKIIVYKLSDDPSVDKSVCVSIAKTKYKNKIVRVSNKQVEFCDTADADNFEEDIKRMFIHDEFCVEEDDINNSAVSLSSLSLNAATASSSSSSSWSSSSSEL
ncbi:hypothetical protein [Perigonia lusca single nucleopolyhedrovirus]|uniref:Uncharacterized protein n=1 Tax=Perigonia lusca single nucleopolyhedrovirus TaxID=1675865 RepID=A0A0M3WPD4_9ABAC|nr:hypothetical protein [Perigonia lusca single nucleopolyhedrovirus]AKN80686.1 hypothetical protein [Perigonia lusca single nucleopolyhedrovirus]